MKNIFKRIICWFCNRHTEEYLKENGGKFHQFYHVSGGGKKCTCPKCGYSVIILNSSIPFVKIPKNPKRVRSKVPGGKRHWMNV